MFIMTLNGDKKMGTRLYEYLLNVHNEKGGNFRRRKKMHLS